ncbi:LysE family translocator [Rhodovibrionaceae bacterium A322]
MLSFLPDAPLFLAFVLASLAVIVAPGPDVVFVGSRAITQGRLVGFAAVLGTSTGLLVHVTAAAFGLSNLFLHAPLAYDILRWLGVAYLLWLAYRTLAAGPVDLDQLMADQTSKGRSRTRWITAKQAYRQGALTNLLNPKVAIFFIAFLPQFVPPQAGSSAASLLALALVFMVLGFIFLASLVFLFGTLGDKLRHNPAFLRWQRWISAGTLGGLALWLASQERE